jgi:hypothetical protein
VINLEHDVKNITLWGNIKSKVYRNLKEMRICIF